MLKTIKRIQKSMNKMKKFEVKSDIRIFVHSYKFLMYKTSTTPRTMVDIIFSEAIFISGDLIVL